MTQSCEEDIELLSGFGTAPSVGGVCDMTQSAGGCDMKGLVGDSSITQSLVD